MAEPISTNGPAVAPLGAKTRGYREAHQVRIRAAATRPSDAPMVQKAITRLDQIMESNRPLRDDVPRDYYLNIQV
ncbi:MAG: hypothetical protein QF830_05860 [Rhodospirillales bacterium]|jgi:hypothetical protein|nr:hypothetical protein [Rhodospirillales bacterium]MDP6883640.1 hypothetical protein [Rhodospirillales bacterium]